MGRLKRQLEFIIEIDKLKHILRQSVLIQDRRNENDAEHSWHLTVMAMVLKEHFVDQDVDLLKAMKMTIIHDLVEIYAGDTFCYDDEGNGDKLEREIESAGKLFSILPEDQEAEFWSLWEEFEERNTKEAKFAACLDRMQPLLLNSRTEGHTWKRPEVNRDKVLERNMILKDNAPALWQEVVEIVDRAVDRGQLRVTN
ncbi:HD domain-containing protein [Alkalibacter saccharofermentans]|uniref:Putative hydrolases of HD superfamily n=1 Tax=Alkalibacter saccharofermentans DSM 14828 TaxID=1120975 RepID=A0A1M4VK03_9FIRM|nr:HD domain-containing protein [Alkalibacter saccharofermentans]SHE69197.1 putative hydrolases of HD superfamily [Alkalibacter saccharofermentans DSM 14828]